WISCVKTVNRTIEFRGESRTTRFCCADEACSNGNGDHEIRAHEDLEYAKLTNFLQSQFGMKAPDVSTDQEEDAAIVETITAPPSNPSGSTASTSNNNCLYCSVDKSDYDYKHSKKPSSYDNAYYNSVANSSDSSPKSYNDFVKEAKKNGGIPSVDEYGNISSNGTRVSDSKNEKQKLRAADANGQTVVNPDGTVTSSTYQDETGAPVVTNRLAQIDQQITTNNESLTNVGNSLTNIEKSLPPGTINSDGSVNSENSEIASELAALRAQISALKDDNKKLAEERRQEVENIRKQREESRVANNPVIQPTPTPSITSGLSGNSVSSGIISSAKVITDQGNTGNSGAVVNNNANPIPSNGIQSGVISSSNVINGTSDSGNSISLSAVSADGETMRFSSGDVLNLEGRTDVSNLDAAKSLALSSDKNAFVYGGKYYVKKGESFVQVSNIKEQERTVASEATPISDIEGVETLLDSYKEKEDLGEDDVTVNPTPTPFPQVNPTISNVQTKETVVEDVDASKRERSFVDKLWGVFDTAGRNLFNFGNSSD
ncbi:MAG: hypothetical protein KC493_09630, partial [Bacteriovoracaceae bacterium]|nr:hypothetical protein [Bacteriovoracaceae bacterium]